MTDGPWQQFTPAEKSQPEAGPWQQYAPPAADETPADEGGSSWLKPWWSRPTVQAAAGMAQEAITGPIPEAFKERLAHGEAIRKALAEGYKEGEGEGPVTGFSPESMDYLISKGTFHDPSIGYIGIGGAVQFANETWMLPAAKGWEAFQRVLSGSLHATAGALGAVHDEIGESGGMTGERLRREVINAGNWAMIEGGMGRFARPYVGQPAEGVRNQVVGTIPKVEDFKSAADVLRSDAAESNLKSLWEERGIHPAEAVHDAQRDPFLKQELAPPSFVGWHGSHADFDAFDLSRIGTGEGNQAFGHGGYFAGNESVARTYVAGGRNVDWTDARQVAAKTLDDYGGNVEAAKEELERAARPWEPGTRRIPADRQEAARGAIKLLEEGAELPAPKGGVLYKVRILADQEHMLDWDRPINEQSEYVQKAMAPILKEFGLDQEDLNHLAGTHIHNRMSERLADGASSSPEVSARLRDAGIPGIRYFDQISRGAEEGTRNFVIFDHDLIQITEKNGRPLDPTKLSPVQGSPVPNGTPRSELAKTGEPHIDRVLDSPVTKRNIDGPVIDDTHDVPHSAGGSVPLHDPTVYIDRHFPRSMEVDGVRFDPAEPLTVRANVEHHVMDTLIRGGMDQAVASRVARFEFAEKAEAAWYRAHGIDQAQAEAAYRPFIDAIRHDNPPANLYREGERLAEPKPDELDIGRAKIILGEFDADLRGAAREMAAKREWALAADIEHREVTRAFPDAKRLGNDSYRLPIRDAGPEAYFEFSIDPDTVRSRGPYIPEEERGKGLGVAAYRRVVDWTLSTGREFWSDTSVSDSAKRVYEALDRRGYDVRFDDGRYKINEGPPAPEGFVRVPVRNAMGDTVGFGLRRAEEVDAEGVARPLGAEVTDPASLPSLVDRPPPRPGRLVAAGRDAIDQMFGIARNLQGFLDPMATGSNRAMVIAKDAISVVRRIRWEHARIDADIVRRFDAEQQVRMWNAADEESVAIQLGESREHQGLVTLTADERAAVEGMHGRAQAAWLHMVDAGGVEGEGLPAYTPRMVLNVSAAADHVGPQALNELGRNVFTRTNQMLHRAHMTAEETEAAARAIVERRMAERGASPEEIAAALESVKIARNIRALPLATARLEEAAVWKEMINKIEEVGKATGGDTVAVGFKPGPNWFTIAGNPAFTKWEPALERNPVTGKWGARTDDAGNVLFVPKPIYIADEFRGPLRSILDDSSSAMKVVPGAPSLYGALMILKGKSMTAILNSPLLHSGVVWGKVAEAAMMKEWFGFGLYWKGNKIVNDNAARANELIERGLNPIGPRGAIQDITGIMESPDVLGGHHKSWTGQLIGFVPGLFDEAAGAAAERGIAKAGNFWHNTLLWDRVRDVQFGLADHLSDRFVAKGVDRLTSDRIAAHLSNLIVGSIPKEAMSAGARATANMLLFSRSFTLGNYAVFKQAAFGLPKPIIAQIERDFFDFRMNSATGVWEPPAGLDTGAAERPAALPADAAAEVQRITKGMARRKALSILTLSVAFTYIGNALLQHANNIFGRDQTIDDETKGYARRWSSLMEDAAKDPFELRHAVGRLSPTYDNEPGKEDRIHIGYDKNGTAVYGRNVTGKYGEELMGAATPAKTLRNKLGPLPGGVLDAFLNDTSTLPGQRKQPIYDETDKTVQGDIATAWAIAKHLVMKHLPESQLQAATDLLRGDGDAWVNKLKLFGPVAGFTTSQGAPSGMARGEVLAEKGEINARFSIHWPDIRKQIQRGDIEGAEKAMTELRILPRHQKYLERIATDPASSLRGKTLKDFLQSATPRQLDRFERAKAADYEQRDRMDRAPQNMGPQP